MKPGLFHVFVIGTIGVWTLALVGLVNVVGAITTTSAPTAIADAPLLAEERASDVAGVELAGLLRYPDAVRTEYHTDRFGDVWVAEVEYESDAALGLVRAHYRAEFERAGWTATVERRYGEWAYTVRSGSRQLVVEIERPDGVTEIEIELTVARPNRGQVTGR